MLNIDFLEVDKIKNKKFKIVLDTINGASCIGFKKILQELNCEIIHINEKPNGIFDRNPEPKTENIKDVAKIVLEHSADLAFITDPDGDRLAIIDNKGQVIIEENTLVLCTDEFLNKTQNKNICSIILFHMFLRIEKKGVFWCYLFWITKKTPKLKYLQISSLF